MKSRFRFKSLRHLEDVLSKLSNAKDCTVLKDRTTDCYLEVPEDIADYIERYLYTPYSKQ